MGSLVPYEQRNVAKGGSVSLSIVAVVSLIVWIASLSVFWIFAGSAAGAYILNKMSKD